jgi:hypothetical protein
MLSVAASWDETSRPFTRFVLLAALVLSVIVQAAVATNDWGHGYAPLHQLDPTPENNVGLLFSNISLSPPLVLIPAWRLEESNLLWYQMDKNGVWHSQLGVGLLLSLCVISAAIIWWRGSSEKLNTYLVWLPPSMAVIVIMFAGINTKIGYPGLAAESARSIADWVRHSNDEPYTIVTMSNEFHIYFLEGYLKGDFVHHWYSPNQTTDFQEILDNTKGRWLSFVADRVHIEPLYSGKDLEWWLNEQFYRIESQWVDDYELVRYANLPAHNWTWRSVNQDFGQSFWVDSFALNKTSLSADDILGIRIKICNRGALPDYHEMFLHLISTQGAINGHDGPIRYGAVYHMEWKKDDCLIEKRGLYIPPDATPNDYSLILGFATPSGRLLARNQKGEPVDHIMLTRVNISD